MKMRHQRAVPRQQQPCACPVVGSVIIWEEGGVREVTDMDLGKVGGWVGRRGM